MADNVYYMDSSAESAPDPVEGSLQGGGGDGISMSMSEVDAKIAAAEA